jgi:hypothetical protein
MRVHVLAAALAVCAAPPADKTPAPAPAVRSEASGLPERTVADFAAIAATR